MKKSLFILMFLLCIVQIHAQVNITKSPALALPASVSLGQCDDIIKVLNGKLDNYKKSGTLFNKKAGRIDRESVEAFKKNFSLDAKLFNDLYEYNEEYLQDLDGYIQLVRSYFPSEGVRFAISNPVLTSIEETDNRYSVVVRLEKQTERYYNSNGEVKDGIRIHVLDFVYDIRKGELNSAKLTFIRGLPREIPAFYFTYWGLELSVGKAIWSANKLLPEVASPTKAGGKIENLNGTAWSVGGTWRSNFFANKKSPSKNLFLVGGIRVSGSCYKLKLSDYKTVPLSKSNVVDSTGKPLGKIYRVGQNIGVTESFTSLGVSVPLGISYRILNKPNSALMVDVSYVPTIALSAKTTVIGQGDYDAYYESIYTTIPQPINTSIDVLKNNNLLGKNRPINYSTEPTKQLSHSLGLSLMYYRDFQQDLNSLGIAVGLDVLWGFTSIIKDKNLDSDKFEYINDKSEDVTWTGEDPWRKDNLGYIYNKRYDGGIIGTYLQKNLLKQIGIKVILYYKQGRKP
jgi:hypothetical protein